MSTITKEEQEYTIISTGSKSLWKIEKRIFYEQKLKLKLSPYCTMDIFNPITDTPRSVGLNILKIIKTGTNLTTTSKMPFNVKSIAKKCFDFGGILIQAAVQSVLPRNNFFGDETHFTLRSKLLRWGFSKFVPVLIL